MSGDHGLLYLDSTDVLVALDEIDELHVLRETLRRHAVGEVLLPEEAALRWEAPDGTPARSLALPAGIEGAPTTVGVKIINANPANVSRSLPRASGLLLLFDPSTARVVCVMAAGHVSSRRTAAVSALAVERFAPSARSLALIGAGPLAAAHLAVGRRVMPDLAEVRLFDLAAQRSAQLAQQASELFGEAVDVVVAPTARDAVVGADVVIAVTTTTTPYVEWDWIEPEATIVNVSLDDCHAEVLERAALLVVDDWSLVANDDHRLLGRMAGAGHVAGPGEDLDGAIRAVDGELGSYLVDDSFVRPSGVCVVNPFGMGIGDVALGATVHEWAAAHGVGVHLPA